MPSGIEALAGRLDLSDAHELGDRLPIACDGDLLLALQHRLGSRPALAQVPHGDGLHGARLTCFTTLGPTGQIGATSLETRSVTRIPAGLPRGHLPRTRNALTLSNTEDSEHVAVCTDGCETRRGHHRNWTGSSRQEPSERPPPGELVDTSLWAGLEHVRPTMRFRRISRASGTSRRSIARQSAKRWRISRSRAGSRGGRSARSRPARSTLARNTRA